MTPAVGRLAWKDAGQFQQCRHARSAVVRAHDGLVFVFQVLVRRGARVPVGEQQDLLGGIRVDDADDVGQMQGHVPVGVVVGERLRIGLVHRGRELLNDVRLALLVGRRAGRAHAQVALRLEHGKGAVAVKGGMGSGRRGRRRRGRLGLGVRPAARREQEGREGKERQEGGAAMKRHCHGCSRGPHGGVGFKEKAAEKEDGRKRAGGPCPYEPGRYFVATRPSTALLIVLWALR